MVGGGYRVEGAGYKAESWRLEERPRGPRGWRQRKLKQTHFFVSNPYHLSLRLGAENGPLLEWWNIG